jgi:diguanylate cyclase (GGDEF)-like protein/PAS domain S-box-containing protein
MLVDASTDMYTPPSPDPARAGLALQDIQLCGQILNVAVKATVCTSAMLYVWEPEGFRLLGSVGTFGRGGIELVVAQPSPDRNGIADRIKIVSDIAEAPYEASQLRLRIDGVAFEGFVSGAIVRSPNRIQGMLLVAGGDFRTDLSPAQIYVLRAQAAHLATLLDLNLVRRTPSTEPDARYRLQSERLRLLESVAIHARDSILITEAEPTHLPGPRILYCNAAFTRTTGYSEVDVLGQTPRILQGPKTDPASRAKLRDAFARWRPIEIELINYRKDGTEFWVELSIVPVANEAGWFTHWVSVQRDITERKVADELATRVRIAEIKNEALATEIQERKRIEAELLYTAFHDSLTGLRNRAFFMDRLTLAIANSAGGQADGCAVIFLDLDRFKVVNDSMGHGTGDALLKEIGQRLKRCTRPQDTLARIGGDEFALLIEAPANLATSVEVAEAIIFAMRMPIRLGRQDIFPACSIGIVQASASYRSPEDLIGDADVAMYQAKRAGQGDYAIFSESMRAEAKAALALQTDVRLAFERSEFLLHYQPIFDLASGVIDGFEALIRWQHPERGLVSPAQFIPAAEEIGLIRQIDHWVLREACAQLRVWQDRFGDHPLHMSVNTSATELNGPGFVDKLKAVLNEFDIDPRTLQIEITEGIFLLPSSSVASALENIRGLGVRIALDDFGTGYSSLSYINRFPVDTIKIDRSFISGMNNDKRTLAIVDLLVKLGAALDVSIVAEGIERAEEARILSDMGCSHVQGYYFARPMTESSASALLSERERQRDRVPLPGTA